MHDFRESLSDDVPSQSLSVPLAALWWDAKGDWQRAHSLVDELETGDAMAVHAYLHRKQGDAANAEYWYRRAGADTRRRTLDDEWNALVDTLLCGPEHNGADAAGTTAAAGAADERLRGK